ncbi:T-cell surface glycoprotein CD1c1 precursor [Cavia porcellus]|uniref:T-cell surface glycoprotein CD1c1 n=1 Tax=Cavia porcellus TaxID=10141 RepID=CD1C1_CAVPO|nr:T-cell surface glycoprotein CD1c1 precursor [Cavia porcellus]Q9QZY8.1 RecName: Full=T-cell surface glycoprotein CD1c1; AltName: CD_antigen=CD1c-1; Flags: Precursor [Cavia porcellus]AAF12742.1 CD1-C1 [Cavia porcellus]
MLFLHFLFLDVVLGGSITENVVQENISFYVMQISSYANKSWVQNHGSGWLDELQTHGWDSESDKIIFLHTWSRGNFSNEELEDLQLLFHAYFSGLALRIQHQPSQLEVKYPFEVQARAGCELHSGEHTKGFIHAAVNGLNFLSYQNKSLVPSPEGGTRAQKFCDLFNTYEGIRETVYYLIRDTCPRFLLGLLDAGKMDLQRQVRPEVWLSSSPNLEPGRLLLACHVSGFYPKPIWVMWMRGAQEQLETKQGDILPHADGTWYLRVTLDVAAREAAGLSCRVRHSSLRDQDIILYWGHGLSVILITFAVIVPLVLLIVLMLLYKKRCTYQGIQ